MTGTETGTGTEGEKEGDLQGAQERIRDAFVAADAGLFVMDCTPGAGKSYTASRITAEELVERAAAGDPAPEYGTCAVSFSREDAADIAPDVVDWIRRLVATDATPAAGRLDEADAERLVRRVRAAANVGTIDGLVRDVFGEVAPEVGFDGMPAVGNEALLATLHRDCVAAVRDDPDLADAVARLDGAYPADDDEDALASLLDDLHTVSRQRRLGPAAVEQRLHRAVAQVYGGGRPTDFGDLRRAAETYCHGAVDDADFDGLGAAERQALVRADRRLHDAWRARIGDLCTVFRAYRERYEALSRERGVVSHGDCAHYVAAYLEGDLGGDDPAATERRERVRARYRDRLRTVVVDEAQDVSTVQHDVLAQLVTAASRVLLVGDPKQCIYVWREAHPELFERAAEDGVSLGVDWDDHVTERATTSYRSRPDVAAAVDALASDLFDDPARGAAAAPAVDYAAIEPDRDPTDGPNVHVARFRGRDYPGSRDWAEAEAQSLAINVAGKLRDGAFADPDDGDQPGVTVLFRWRRHMGTYAEAFEARGLSVGSASDHLFESDAVAAVLAAVGWLADPSPETCHRLLVDALGLDAVARDCSPADCSLAAAREALRADDHDDGLATLDALAALHDDVARRRVQPAAVLVQDVVDALELRVDPLGVEPDGAQRVANLDRLVDLVREWEGADRYDAAQLHELFEPFRAAPHTGPTQPVDAADHDVVFRTVHQAKGDEDDVVVLADPTFSPLPNLRRGWLLTAGDALALAPPADVLDQDDVPAVPGVGGGLYDPRGDRDRRGSDPERSGTLGADRGLRWASRRWVTTAGGDPVLAGPPGVREAVRTSVAESWRLLFVAASRARNHLVVPVASGTDGPPRERWSEAVRAAFDLGRDPERGRHVVAGPRPFAVSVNETGWVDATGLDDEATPPLPPRSGAFPEPAWMPRFVQPSTVYPLASDPDRYVLDHLLGRSLHSDSAAVEGPAIPFETMGPEEVGQFVHGVVASLAVRRVSAPELRSGSDAVDAAVDRQFARSAPDATDGERRAIRAYLAETILPQLADSTLWERVRDARAVHTEVALERVHRVDGADVEVNGKADLVVEAADGTRSVEDLKTGLAATAAETAARYRTQTALYAWMLAADPASDAPVVPRLTTVGESFDEEVVDDAEAVARGVLERLVPAE